MPMVRDRYIHLCDQDRRERVADLLAREVVRHLKQRRPDSTTVTPVEEVAHKAKNGLEVSAKTRLHVTHSGDS